jgi:hypothetical protein
MKRGLLMAQHGPDSEEEEGQVAEDDQHSRQDEAKYISISFSL